MPQSEDAKFFADKLVALIAPLLKVNGYKKQKFTWRREFPEAIAVLNIQKSRWGDNTYYVNLGEYFLSGEPMDNPFEYDCHARARLPQLLGERDRLEWEERENEIRGCFREGRDASSALLAEHNRKVALHIESSGLSWLQKLVTLEGIRTLPFDRSKPHWRDGVTVDSFLQKQIEADGGQNAHPTDGGK